MKKQFNLEAALNGEPFECDEHGNEILKWMYCEEVTDYPISCYIKGAKFGGVSLYMFNREGICGNAGINLVMSPKKVTRWFNVFSSVEYGLILGGKIGNESEENAREHGKTLANYVTTIPIEIELP